MGVLPLLLTPNSSSLAADAPRGGAPIPPVLTQAKNLIDKGDPESAATMLRRFLSGSPLAEHLDDAYLLMGAALTQRPDLARAVWCAVPLLDMIRFPQFLIARLWTDEYGDPDVADEFGWLWGYSPYHRVSEGAAYPAVMFTTAEGDTRVDPCHARKMAARLVALVPTSRGATYSPTGGSGP